MEVVAKEGPEFVLTDGGFLRGNSQRSGAGFVRIGVKFTIVNLTVDIAPEPPFANLTFAMTWTLRRNELTKCGTRPQMCTRR